MRFAGLSGPAVRTDVDATSIGEGFVANGAIRVTRVDTRTGGIILDPASTVRIPSACLGLEMVVTVRPRVAVDQTRLAFVRIPVPGFNKVRLGRDVPHIPIDVAIGLNAATGKAVLNIAVADCGASVICITTNLDLTCLQRALIPLAIHPNDIVPQNAIPE